MPQLPEEKSGQTSGRERELWGAGRWGGDLRLLLRSWSGDLDFLPLGTGWAALFSLLVVYRAGMANRASAKPGEQRQGKPGLASRGAPASPPGLPGQPLASSGCFPFPTGCIDI